MFKRFQVMDLFHKDKEVSEVKEWVDAEKKLPNVSSDLFKVKLSTGEELLAYYFDDGIVNLCSYYKMKTSKWWNKLTREPLYNVTHWGMKDED